MTIIRCQTSVNTVPNTKYKEPSKVYLLSLLFTNKWISAKGTKFRIKPGSNTK